MINYQLPSTPACDTTSQTPVHRLCVVVWRNGGTANFKWHRTLGMSEEIAIACAADVLRMGYKCFIDNYVSSMAKGLPRTYDGQ